MSDLFKLLFTTILHCALLTSPTLMAQETPPAENASETNIAKPTLDELMAKFAEIEASYLPFHIEYSGITQMNRGPFSADRKRPEFEETEVRLQRGHQEPNAWMLETTVESQGVSRTERLVKTESGLHRKETSPEPPNDGFDDGSELPVRPLEGIFPLTFQTKTPILLSQHFAAAPTEFTLDWFETLAKVVCHYRPAKDPYVTVELWLDPDFAWHPIFMRRYDMHAGNRLPDEWKVTEFRKLKELARVSAGEFTGPIRHGLVTKDASTQLFLRSRFQILKSAYQDRVPDAVFSPETPIGGSPIQDLEPIGGEQIAVTSHQQAERTLAALFTTEIREEAREAMDEPAATEIPVAVAAIADDEISTQIMPLAIELRALRERYGSNHPKVVSLENKLAAMKKAAKQKMQETPAVPSADREQLKIFNLKNSNAKEAADIVTVLYSGPSVRITIDERTNAVIVRADESRLLEIEAVLLRLDSTETAGKSSETTIQQSSDFNVPVTPIAEYRRQLDALEQPVLRLAEQVRAAETKHGKDHPDSAKLRADLRAAVQQTFAARQEIQRAELAEFTRRLQRMQQSIDSRDRIVDRIVERRVEELLDPNLNWAQPQSGKVASVASPKPPELLDVGQIGENVQKVTLTMFDVTDASFMKEREINAEPSLAPTDLNEQLLRMKDSKTVKIQGIHKIETILNQTATFHSGGTFKVPVSSGGEFVKDREFGTRITIRPHLQGDETIFECVWSELLVNWNTSINGFPGVDEKRLSVVVKSPLPGGTGYLCGPFAGSDSSHRRFISFYLHGANDATKSATEATEKSSALQTSVPQKAVQNVNAPETLASGSQLATLPGSGFVVAANDQTSPPQSDAEKAIARFVLVFFQDEARRAVPGLMIDHGTETLILTTGPATIVPDGASHAIDRTFVEVPGATAVEAEFLNTKTADIRIHRAKSGLTQFQLKEPVTLKIDDSLSAILLSGQPTLRVTPKAARVAALDQPATFSLATHKFRHEFTGLIQIDQRLPEGTPLFKDGELAGITLLGTRFMKDDMPGSFVVPVSRIVEVLQQLKTQDEGPSAEPNETASPTPLSETSVADELP